MYEYQEEDIRPSDGLRLDDNEIYAKFLYEFDDEKKQLILTDRNNGNVYHLDRVGEAQTGDELMSKWQKTASYCVTKLEAIGFA